MTTLIMKKFVAMFYFSMSKNRIFPTIKFNNILVSHLSIGSLSKHKYKQKSKGMRSAVVYKYQCPKCGAQYVGSTIRNLSTRAAKHSGVSVRIRLSLSQPSQSHIRNHIIASESVWIISQWLIYEQYALWIKNPCIFFRITLLVPA